MTKIIYYMIMSLDGFVTAADVSQEHGLGIGGERLHDWTGHPQATALFENSIKETGAVITGRTTYDNSPGWGLNGPVGELRTPTFVLTHRETQPAEGSVYTFVTDGIDSLAKQAKEAAGDKDVSVSGAEVGRQLLQGGHIDEMWISLVPVLFGDGTRLYEHAGGEHIQLELIESISTPGATHLHYRVLN